VHEREKKKKKKKTVSERNLIRRRSLSALREPPGGSIRPQNGRKTAKKEKARRSCVRAAFHE
jgi:hypothetical protein